MTKNYKGWKKVAIFALITVFALTVMVGCSQPSQSADPGAEEKGTIKIGLVNWAECVAVSNLWKVILEDQGYTVEITQLDVAPLFTGLSNGDLDFFMDSWLPFTHEAYWTEFGDKLEDIGIWYEEDAKIGLAVPTYVTIDSIAEMKDNADKFDSQIIGIDPGAGIMKAANNANESYGLGFEVVQGSEPAMMAALDKAYNNEEWVAVTGWSPHMMFAKYELKYLDDPNGDFGSAEEIHTLARQGFSADQPEVTAMLKKFSMSDAQIGGLTGMISDGMEPAEAAKKWIEENQDAVNSWIK